MMKTAKRNSMSRRTPAEVRRGDRIGRVNEMEKLGKIFDPTDHALPNIALN
jgi:hypothetical protein